MTLHTDDTVGTEEPGHPDRDPRISGATGGLPEFKLRRVTAYIKNNLHRELPLAELTAVVHMSPYHFARLFKRSTGVSPYRFVVHRRIDEATALLAASGASIGAIARAVGFRTSAHFMTTFRRVTGVTPSMYRTTRAALRAQRRGDAETAGGARTE